MPNIFLADRSHRRRITEELAPALVRALAGNPFYPYVFPKPEKREGKMLWWMRALLDYGLRRGRIFVLDDFRGAAVWLGPERPLISTWGMLRSGLYRAPWIQGLAGLGRMLEYSSQWETWHHQEPKRHLYLMLLGIDPPLQRQGWGSRLITPVLKEADAGGLTCYLETQSENNLDFYRKYGFKIVQTGRSRIGDVHWAMRR